MLGAQLAVDVAIAAAVLLVPRALVLAVLVRHPGDLQPAPALLERAQAEVPVLVAVDRRVEAPGVLPAAAPAPGRAGRRRSSGAGGCRGRSRGSAGRRTRPRSASSARSSSRRPGSPRAAGGAMSSASRVSRSSASTISSSSESEFSKPALRAAATPAFRWRISSTPSGSSSSARSVSASVEPSSTTITLGGPPCWPSARSTDSSRKRPWLKQGITTVMSPWPGTGGM